MTNTPSTNQVSAAWLDDTTEELATTVGGTEAARIVGRFRPAIPGGYDELNWPATAALDLATMDSMLGAPDDSAPRLEMIHFVEDDERTWRLRLYLRGGRMALADLLPLMANVGLRALDERSFSFDVDGTKLWLHDVGVELPAEVTIDDDTPERIKVALAALLDGSVEADNLNSLAVLGGLAVRDVEILRAYSRYLRQINFPFSQTYIESVLLRHADLAATLVELFTARFDPDSVGDDDAAEAVHQRVLDGLDAVPGLDDDRTVRAVLGLIDATLRTNAYQRNADGSTKAVLSFKFDPTKIADLPLPRPMYEVWVCSPRVEGVHLRNGPIARGGIRWSDRREDFRTEILGLVKAQIVKNSVIVPTGAKGGFVLKQPPAKPEQLREEGVACYRQFIAGLLDITDNIVDGTVVHPPRTVRLDGDDTYLVVAADKGTASFSDIANAIAADYDFWLGDAFASGGSAGYDHKEMGITARGAWESVRRHARALGKDADTDALTVVGIGDMSGDVFGNGLLRSAHVRLVAAFDHRDIFIDPDPDPAESFAERKRLFELPRSSWKDYSPGLISQGGGVFSRTMKSITISPEARKMLGVEEATFTPNELISAVLRAPVDLLWNGGIGTYVKAVTQSNADVGDRANDGLRVNGGELRTRMVGEGGNLGFTQLGRIEYALRGGLIFTDAIDNSAGVDCSDHEVNIKILLNPIVARGAMTLDERNALLESMTAEVAELVLDDNKAQSLALTVARTQSLPFVNVHARYLSVMETEGWINRGLEFLPTDKQIAERQASGIGLTTPELAVLLAYTKTSNTTEVVASALPDDPYLLPDLLRYFPTVLRQRFAAEIAGHQLRREIVATMVSNQMSNLTGISFDHRIHEETGAGIVDIMHAWLAARDVMRIPEQWDEIDALGTEVRIDTRIELFMELRGLIDRSTLWLLRHRRPPLDIGATVDRYGERINSLYRYIEDSVRGKLRDRLFTVEAGRLAAGVPESLAQKSVVWPLLHTGFDIVDLSDRRGVPMNDVAAAYWQTFEALDLGWLWTAVGALPRGTRWQSQARAAIRDDFFAAMGELAEDVILTGTTADWLAANEVAVRQALSVFTELRRVDSHDVTTMSVAMRQLHNLSVLGSVDSLDRA